MGKRNAIFGIVSYSNSSGPDYVVDKWKSMRHGCIHSITRDDDTTWKTCLQSVNSLALGIKVVHQVHIGVVRFE